MVVRISKKDSGKSKTEKIKKVSAKSKKINWDKYFKKVKFPVDAIAYQQKMRNEWWD